MPDALIHATYARISRAHAASVTSDGWIPAAWVGEWDHRDGPEKTEAKDLQAVLENFRAEAEAAGDDWPGIPLYVGHPEEEGTLTSAPAQAWLKQARIRSVDGEPQLEYFPEWCGDSRAALIGERRYKYVSSYAWGIVDEDGFFRERYHSSVGLTNVPVKRVGQTPLANAQHNSAAAAAAQAGGHMDTPAAPAADSARTDADRLALVGFPNGQINEDIAAKVAEIIGDAETRDEAWSNLMDHWHEHMRAIDANNGVDMVITSMASASGRPRDQVAADPAAALQCIVDRAHSAESALAETTVELLVAEGSLADTEQARANAKSAIAADRDSALGLIRANAAGGGAQAPSDPLSRAQPQPVADVQDARANADWQPTPEQRREMQAEIEQRCNAGEQYGHVHRQVYQQHAARANAAQTPKQ